MGPPAPVAACRTAVREALRDLVGQPNPRVLVAVSGGADSLALLAASCFVGPRLGVSVGAVTVDHGLQHGSLERARRVAAHASALGADPVSVWHVTVDGPGGPEAAARRARYRALRTQARAARADAVLLAHSRDDQAETVLLGLARGSGSRSLAGMGVAVGLFRRPLLGLPRETLVAAAGAAAASDDGLTPWDDPHNSDPAYLRARVRHQVLPVLEAEIGPGVAAALARTAELLRADADALDEWAEREAVRLVQADGVDAVGLSALPRAVRTRVLRQAALQAGSAPSDLTAAHVRTMDGFVMGEVSGMSLDLPGRVRATRVGGRLRLSRDVPG
jgi:tRNA(Ile)-lysidine synthase